MSLHRTAAVAALFCLALASLVAAAESTNLRRTPIVEAIERVRPAVVNIHSERAVRGPAGEEAYSFSASQNRVNGMGTGILIDPRGYIITNHHVIEDVSIIRIRLHDGSTHTGRILARDQETDLALLKIDVARPLPTIPFGTAADLMVGETVIAIGNAYGYEHTVTVGIVSAIKRDVTLNKEMSYKSLIQTDASINPGNSGGPLINIHGELVGVNVAIRAGAQGIGFAIPVDTMLRVAADMLSIRRRNSIWHGLICRDEVETPLGASIQPSAAERDEGKTAVAGKRRLVIERTEPASPAGKAGLQAGDLVLRVAETRISCALELERALLDRAAGERVAVVVRRKGEEQQVELVLQALERPTSAPPPDVVWRKLGLRLTALSPEVVNRAHPQLHGGLAVTEVQAEGPAARAGIQRGDILVGLHQWETINADNVIFVLTHPDLASFQPLRFFILRQGIVHRGSVLLD